MSTFFQIRKLYNLNFKFFSLILDLIEKFIINNNILNYEILKCIKDYF